jgi:phosphate transport system substrate-binding protein
MVFSEYIGYTGSIANSTIRKTYSNLSGRILACVQGFFFVMLLWGCDQKSKPIDSATQGDITIAADESFQPLIQAEVDAFMAAYKYAKIRPIYAPESEAVNLMLRDSARFVVMTRLLTAKERSYFEEKKITPRVIKIAIDAVALIVNKNNTDTLLTMDQLRDIFSGKVTTWNQLGNQGLNKNIVTVFDNSNSSNLSYIRNKMNMTEEAEKRIFAAKSNQQVIEYVQKNDGALGVIGIGWISDSDDPKQQEFIRNIRVIAVADTVNPTIDDYYLPYQAYLALKKYPLSRDLYIVSREARTGLGTGFAAYITGQIGQTIVLKEGLLPATMPVRLIEFKK